ncbi:MAG: prepilin peptidase, partial [Alphaproteobacteria bacterium]|nr:prepilin peptidase [Alphaproteobacteria bacterium]
MLFFQGILTCFLLAALAFDLTRYIIPNWIVGIIILLYPVMLVMTPESVDWVSGLTAFAVMFVAGMFIYALKLMGGGDIKLLAACALWTGTTEAWDLAFYTAMLGGVLSLGLLLLRPAVNWADSRLKKPLPLPRLLRPGEPVPYGLAITGAMLMVVWHVPA